MIPVLNAKISQQKKKAVPLSFDQLEDAVREFERQGRTEIYDTGLFQVEPGRCVDFSNNCMNWIRDNHGISLSRIGKRSGDHVIHQLLSGETSDHGTVYVDPTLGQFVHYPRIFIGNLEELRDVFLDENIHFFPFPTASQSYRKFIFEAHYSGIHPLD